jgi:hypothetical protein
MGLRDACQRNGDIYSKVLGESRYDLVVGDECFEPTMAVGRRPEVALVKFVLMYDYLGVHALSWSAVERMVARTDNKFWSRSMTDPRNTTKGIYIGEKEASQMSASDFYSQRREGSPNVDASSWATPSHSTP